jgi:putative colanic acid biosynthesis acetyltransferase WcaF
MGAHSCIGEHVDCYSAAPLSLGEWSMVSQYCFLCTASHDYESGSLPGFQKPITIGPYAWVAADTYVGPGVSVGTGAVVGARSSVYKDVPEWTVVGGNPAKFIRGRNWRPSDPTGT